MDQSDGNDNTTASEEDKLIVEKKLYRQKIVIACFCSLSFFAGTTRAIQVPIIIPESLKLDVPLNQAQWILLAFHASSLPTLLLQPSLNKWGNGKFAVTIGLIGWFALGIFYICPMMGKWYLYVAVIARLVGGTCYYLICNKIIVGMVRIFQGNASHSSVTWDVSVSAGTTLGSYLGPFFVNLISFSDTMLLCACLILAVSITLGIVFPSQNASTEEQERAEYKKSLKMHFMPYLIGYGWGPQICIGACMIFVDGNLTYFYMQDYDKSYTFGGVMLGISSIVYSLTSFIIGYIGSKTPSILPRVIEVGLLNAGIQLIFLGPVFSINHTADIWISVISFNLLLISSSAVQYATLTYTAKKVSELMTPEEAMSIAINVWYMAFNIGACIGPLIAGALIKDLGFRTVFVIGSPFLFVFAALPYFIKIATSPAR